MRTTFPLLIRLAVVILLIDYGIEKLADPVTFLKSIREYDLLPLHPTWMINFLPSLIPMLEIAAGICILTGFLRRGAATIMSGFLLLFTFAIFLRTLDVMGAEGIPFAEVAFDCGCGSGVVVIWQKIVTNGALIAGTIYCAMPARKAVAS